MKKLLPILFLFATISASAQYAPAIKWQNTIGGNGGDNLFGMKPTNDGGYVLAGRSSSVASGDKTETTMGGTDYWVVKIDSSGNILYQNTIGGGGNDDLTCVSQTANGGFIFGGFSDSDISGDKSENSLGFIDYWIVKTDSLLNIQWQNTIGGNGLDYLQSVEQTHDGGYILAGYSNSNPSADKSEDTIGGSDYWIVKTDSVGNIEWDNTIGGSGNEYLFNVKPTSDGGYILAGRSESDSSPDKSENSLGSADYWVVKTDSSGTVQWENTIGGNWDDDLNLVAQTFDGGYILGGYSRSTISGDKTETSFSSSLDWWIVKTDAAGNIQWQNTIGGSAEEGLSAMEQTSDSGYIFGGFSSSPISGDIREKSLGRDFFIVKTDQQGNIMWRNSFTASNEDWLRSLYQTPDGYILAGYSASGISGDKTENCVGWYDYWVIKLTDDFNTITGKLFIDANSNGIQDTGEVSVPDKKITEINTGAYSFSSPDGSYAQAVLSAGNFAVSPAAIDYYLPAPAVQNCSFAGLHLVDSLNDFAYQPAGIFNDLCITITPVTAFRPGFDATYLLTYENIGTTAINPTVIFFPDSGLTFVSSIPSASSTSPDSIVWNLGTLQQYHSASVTVIVYVDAGIAIGSLLNSNTRIEPVAGDANPACNTSFNTVTVRSSHDPNLIMVDKNAIEESDLQNPPFLEYIIYFQNTGTDTAINVKILNPIDSNMLDLSTLELVASSDPVALQYISWERNIEFTFDQINLPDSNVDEPASHGFVQYRIKPKSTLIAGDSILNSAYIYFDFNNPVYTNVVSTRIILEVSANEIAGNNEIALYPNPATSELNLSLNSSDRNINLKIYDATGRKVYAENISVTNKKSIAKINLEQLNGGLYFIEISDKNNRWYAKFIKK